MKMPPKRKVLPCRHAADIFLYLLNIFVLCFVKKGVRIVSDIYTINQNVDICIS